jgi:phosphomannomutase
MSTLAKTPPMQISFGTDGWRAVIADSFTFENVRLVARAIARYVQWEGRRGLSVYRERTGGTYPSPFRPAGRGLVIGYDTRFLSPRFARAVAEEVAGQGVPVMLSDEFAPTPAISQAVRDLDAAGAIIVTASHNPAEYNGIKFKPEYASSGLPEIMDAIVPFIREEQKQASAPPPHAAPIRGFSPLEGFRKELRALVDLERIGKSSLDIVVDPMHGAGVGVIRSLLPGVREIRGNPDPTFGGYNPEPIDKNLGPLVDALASGRAPAEKRVGVATDGDADRVGAMDGSGHFFNSHEIFAVMMWHLVLRKGWKGGVVKTFSTSEMIPRLAKHFGLPVYQTPIGFKYIVEHMLEHDILMGGEESGGLGIKNHIPERDGILSSLLLLEAAAWDDESVRQVVSRIHEITGPFAYDRTDLHLPTREQMAAVVTGLARQSPATFAGRKVERVETVDGVKFVLADDAWILFRPSGTEPVLRVYCEARSRSEVDSILAEGVKTAQQPSLQAQIH